jgi:aspartyl-tRNA(Asn)/glutamyl-tRNA(Gln) amidotransferase subunit A
MTAPPTITGVAALYRQRATTPREVTETCLARITAQDATLNAFTHVMADEALAAADRAVAELAAGHDRGPLHGIPVAVKDIIDIAGQPTGYGSHPAFRTHPTRNAAIIDRLETAGAVIIGKTNCLEFAYGAVNPAVGQTNNPHDPTRTAGGSSGGSAAAVAAGMALATIGTDTGGSIRIPAAYCGVTGLKPTYGTVPMDGTFPLSPTLDHAGPIARTAADTLTVLDALTATTGPTAPIPPYTLRLGILRDHSDAPCIHPDVRAAFDATCRALQMAGATLTDIRLDLTGMAETLVTILLPEAALIHATRRAAHPTAYAPATLAQIDAGPTVTAMDWLRAMDRRRALTAAMDSALDGLDALIAPTAPWVAPAEDPAVTHDAGFDEMLCTGPTNLTGLPSVTIPCGTGAHGLPVGLLLTGPRHGDRRLLRLAAGIAPHLQS